MYIITLSVFLKMQYVALICEGLIFFIFFLESFLSKACKWIASKFICDEFVKRRTQNTTNDKLESTQITLTCPSPTSPGLNNCNIDF